MKTKNISLIMYVLISITFLASCSQQETVTLTSSNSQITPPRSLQDQIELMGFDTSITWQELDAFYRENIAETTSRDLKNNCFITLVRTKNFLEKADLKTLEYYAFEQEKVNFNFNLDNHVALINTLSASWGRGKTTKYARGIHDKNVSYWNANFPGQTSYLKQNEQALKDLKLLTQ